MRNVALVMALAACTVVICQQAVIVQAGRGTITGVVVDQVSGKPVGDVVVHLQPTRFGPGQPPNASYLTRDDGRFEFRDVVPSSYTINASKSGRSGTYGKLRAGGSGVTVDLLAGQRIDGLEIRLWRSAIVSGTVVDERNQPMVGVPVELVSLTPVTTRFGPSAPHVYTNDQGQYRLTNFAPGEYFACALVQHMTSAPADFSGNVIDTNPVKAPSGLIDEGGRFVMTLNNAPIPPPPGPHGERWTYVTTCVPDVTRFTLVQPLEMRAGEDRTGLDIHMTPARSFRVTGQILHGAERDSIVHVRLRADEPNIQLAPAQMSATDETLMLMEVPEGDYTLEASRTFGRSDVIMNDQAGLYARLPVSVHDRDVTGLVVTMHPGPTVTGRVEFDEPPQQTIRLSADLRELSGDWFAGYYSAVEKDGKIAFAAVPPGRYELNVHVDGPRQDWMIKSATSGGRDVADRPFDVADSGVSDLVITVTRRRTSLSGHVDDRGNVGRGAAVVVFPVDPDSRVSFGTPPRRVRAVRSDLAGRYEFSGLPPGEYYVAAIDEGAMDPWPRASFLQSVAGAATFVRLTDGENRVLDLHVSSR